jgi:hypothetical protein
MIPFLNRNDEKWPHTRIYLNYAKLIQKKRESAANYLFRNTFDFECSLRLCSVVNWTMFNDVLIVSLRRRLTSWAYFSNLTFNFNSLLGIVYVSFSMKSSQRWKNAGDFDRQFLFEEYICGHFASLRFKKSIIVKLNNCSFVLCKNWIV